MAREYMEVFNPCLSIASLKDQLSFMVFLWFAACDRDKNTRLFCECRKHNKYVNTIATHFLSEF